MIVDCRDLFAQLCIKRTARIGAMSISRETLDRLAASFPDFLSRAHFVDLFGRVEDIDQTVAVTQRNASRTADHLTIAGFCAGQVNMQGLGVALEAGADPNAGSMTPLMQVARHVREQRTGEGLVMVDMLLSAGADVTQRDCRGMSALAHLAAAHGSSSLARRLVEAGADPADAADVLEPEPQPAYGMR